VFLVASYTKNKKFFFENPARRQRLKPKQPGQLFGAYQI
jgi:hypothetical protein